jgi:tetratricopeptide (TPR) repeat protein
MKTVNLPRLAVSVTLCVAALAKAESAGSAPAENYQGAVAVLQQAAESSHKANSEVKASSPAAQLRADLKTFQKHSATLTPVEAAKQWLALVDRFTQLTETPANFFQQAGEEASLEPQELLEALPPPATWAELTKAIESRPPGEGVQALHELGLRLLAHALAGDVSKRQDDLAALQAFAAKAKSNQTYFYNPLFEELGRYIVSLQDNPDAVLQALESKLSQQSQTDFQSHFQIPDLVSLVGPEKAEAFLRRALVKSKGQLEIDAATATDKLAQKLALELVKDLKTPQWSLVNSLDAADLYEAMEKRFAPTDTNAVPVAMPGLPVMQLPAQTPNDYEKQTARIYYLLGLVAHGRTADAVQVAKQFEKENNAYFPDEVIREMERGGFISQLNGFFHDLLQQNPELPFWEEYVQLAAHADQTAEMVNLVKATLAKPELSKSQRLQLRQLLYAALLANDEVEAGVAELRRLIQTNAQPVMLQMNYEREDRGQLALKLAQIGHLLNHLEWQEEGVAAAKEAGQKPELPDYSSWGNSTAISLAKFLEDIHRGPEAESVLAVALSNAVAQKQSQPSFDFSERNPSAGLILAALARLYHDAGRDADVIQLFDQAPYWGAKDLAGLNVRQIDLEELIPSFSYKHTTVPVGFYLASALAKTGRPAEARKLLDALFAQSPGCDRLYELLLSLDDAQVPSELDALFARDQFEERPLIWKAHWLRTHQRLEEAEQAARKAISIDPTDGEEGPGDRLRAYAELAEIRAARGDTNEAATLRGAVGAVHEAELADQFNSAGLLKQALAMYQDSLTKFADAYCIHARLAILLSDLGQHEAAEEHYRRAYELMPDSFGRVESYCFGCQRAFDGERAQSIAETVFTRLVKETPNKPQVHYMLGYLRDEEGRYQEALASYRVAVRLDPDYLNAWVKIESINEHIFQSAAERDAVVFNLLRLDPQGQHASPSFELVSDLAALWNNVAAANAKLPAKPESLYLLSASKAEMEKQEVQTGNQGWRERMEYIRSFQESAQAMTPGKAVAQNGFIQTAQRLLGREAASGMEE